MTFADLILETVSLAPMTTLAIADELGVHHHLVRDQIGPLLRSGELIVHRYEGEGPWRLKDRAPMFGLPVVQAQARAA